MKKKFLSQYNHEEDRVDIWILDQEVINFSLKEAIEFVGWLHLRLREYQIEYNQENTKKQLEEFIETIKNNEKQKLVIIQAENIRINKLLKEK